MKFFGYDPEMQLETAVRRDSSQALLKSLRYGYDAAGNRTSVTDDATANFLANNLNQLTEKRGFGPTLFSGHLKTRKTPFCKMQLWKMEAEPHLKCWIYLNQTKESVRINSNEKNFMDLFKSLNWINFRFPGGIIDVRKQERKGIDFS